MSSDTQSSANAEIPELPASEDAWIGIFNPTGVDLKLPLFRVAFSYLILEVEKGVVEGAILSTYGQVEEDFPLECNGNSCTTTDRTIAQKLADEGHSVMLLRVQMAMSETGFWRRLNGSECMKKRLCTFLKSDIVFRFKNGGVFTDIQAARKATGETPYFQDGCLICSNVETVLTIFERTQIIPEIIYKADL